MAHAILARGKEGEEPVALLFEPGAGESMKENGCGLTRQFISTLTERDESLFQTLLVSSHRASFSLSYEESFAFYSHRAGYFPMKFYNGHLLAPFYSRSGRFSILRPLGKWSAATVIGLADHLFALSGQPVTFLRLTYDQFTDLSSVPGFSPKGETDDLEDIEDNRYPQLVIPIAKLLQSVEDLPAICAGSFPESSYLRRILRAFEKRYQDSFTLHRLDETHLPQVELLIEKWSADFRSRYQRDRFETPDDDRANIVFPNNDEFLSRPYRCLLHRFSKKVDMRSNFAFVAYMADKPAGFLFLSRTSSHCAALYANLALTQYRGLSYYALYRVLKEMVAHDVHYLNLGGQETNTLRRFYLRFNPIPAEEKEKRCYDGHYHPIFKVSLLDQPSQPVPVPSLAGLGHAS